jgi:hypothetical protein
VPVLHVGSCVRIPKVFGFTAGHAHIREDLLTLPD